MQRTNATLAIHRQYLATFTDPLQNLIGHSEDAFRREKYRIRCIVYTDAQSEGELQNVSLPPCAEISEEDFAQLDEVDSQATSEMRKIINERVARATRIDGDYARRILSFLGSLQACVEADNCDRDIAVELFMADLHNFLQLTCSLTGSDPLFNYRHDSLMDFTKEMDAPWSDGEGEHSELSC